jgi:hypothetical protein
VPAVPEASVSWTVNTTLGSSRTRASTVVPVLAVVLAGHTGLNTKLLPLAWGVVSWYLQPKKMPMQGDPATPMPMVPSLSSVTGSPV